MRTIFSLIMAIAFIFSKTAAQKNDQQWILGAGSVSPKYEGGVLLDFSTETPVMDSIIADCYLNITISNICDSSGQLKCYSNGCKIFNIDAEVIEGGDSINFPGFEFREECEKNKIGYGLPYGQIALPLPGSDDEFYFFHLRSKDNAFYYGASSLLYSHVDMKANNGKGKVLERNIELRQDSFLIGVYAVRHGNGRDWWICSASYDTARYILYQLTPDGVKGPFERKPPKIWYSDNGQGYGSMARGGFSPDGTKFCHYYRSHPVKRDYELGVFDFDRCSGEFSNPRTIPTVTVYDDSMNVIDFKDYAGGKIDGFAGGFAFSPNSRFLYATTGLRAFQFDLNEQNLSDVMEIVGEYVPDPIDGVWWATLNDPELAMNGKIYISCTNSSYFLHVIEQPDEKGANCLFHNRGLAMPKQHAFFLPSHPNYRLHEDAHSPCDSLTVYSPTVDSCLIGKGIFLAPNPTADKTTIKIRPCASGDLRVWNALGQLMLEKKNWALPENGFSINVENWASGAYFVEFRDEKEQKTFSAKFIVSR